MPLFSILIPSRNRLDLLRLAVASIVRQEFSDFEVIVSDNASFEDYKSFIDEVADPRIGYFRMEGLKSVTANWNNALREATGTYVLMLGDDDALSPGLLSRLAKIIEDFDQPQVLYMKAYHYLYPDVSRDAPDGYLREISNSSVFLDHAAPYLLDDEHARDFARAAVSFQHLVSFNAQHFLWRRDFTTTLAHQFFEPPYPDYFACFYTFAMANDIVVVSDPSVIIGISKQSFGYFFLNNRQEEGALAFAGEQLVAADFRPACSDKMIDAIAYPGPGHYRNWLLTSMQFIQKVKHDFIIDIDKYFKIQIVESVAHCLSEADAPRSSLFSARTAWKQHWSFFDLAWSRLSPGVATGQLNQFRFALLMEETNLYFPASVNEVPIGSHRTILDAFDGLDAHREITSALPESNGAGLL